MAKKQWSYQPFAGKVGRVQGRKATGEFWPTIHVTLDGVQTSCGVGLFKEEHLKSCRTNWTAVTRKATCRTCVAKNKPVKAAKPKQEEVTEVPDPVEVLSA